jgi:acyl-coenzyme A thioesterase 13
MHNARAGGMAIATHGLEHTGLSVDIHVSYLSTAKEDDILTIEGKTTKVGRNLGFTTVNIFKGPDHDLTLVASGSHTKYILRDNQGSKTS